MTSNPEDDDTLWRRFTKDIAEIPKGPDLPDEPSAKTKARTKRPTQKVPPGSIFPTGTVLEGSVPVAQKNLPGPAPGTELDRRTEERLLSGRMPIDGRIDLHGMTQVQAQRALEFFIQESLAQGRRTVLVITGKGRGGAAALDTAPEDWLAPQPGALRQNMPRWLEAPAIKPHILRIAPAQPKHGGSGAFYVYLRRSRA